LKETSLEQRKPQALKEKAQLAVSLGVVSLMLYIIGFPAFLLIFFGVLGFFVWKIFSPESRVETRKIFEFYLSANEILRDDERRWYGFEIKEATIRGENLLRTMSTAPPLVHFSLGALYQRLGDHASAAKHLADAVEKQSADEMTIIFPPIELREYVRLLRRIERAPAESPLTAAAVRSLERKRKNHGKKMLAESRELMHTMPDVNDVADVLAIESSDAKNETATLKSVVDEPEPGREPAVTYNFADIRQPKVARKPAKSPDSGDRQTISEVLHDLYDKNA
jgi:hypothetical protein